MKIAHHALEFIDGPPDRVRDAIRQWLADTGFKIMSSPSEFSVRAERGSAIGVTDQQTKRIMEVIIRGSGSLSAVSVYHHTGRIGPLVGTMFGALLSDEVNALWKFLRDALVTSR